MRGPGGENESSEDESSESVASESESSSEEESQSAREFLEGVSKLTQIESLRIEDCGDYFYMEDFEDFPRDELRRLAGLKNLKVLIVAFGPGSQGLLSHFPALPKLATIHIKYSDVSGQDLRHLAVFPRLKSLDLTDAKFVGAELADLAPLKSLEELTIDAACLSKQTLDSLRAVKQLKSLFIRRDFALGGFLFGGRSGPTSTLALDQGDRVWVPEEEVDVFRRAGNAATIQPWNRH